MWGVILDLLSIITAIADAVVHFSTAIQWAFTFLSSIFFSVLDIYNVAYDIYSYLHPIIDSIPTWFAPLALLFIAYSIIMFFIKIGGD